MVRKTALLSTLMEKINKADEKWSEEIKENKAKVDLAIEIGSHEDANEIIKTILEADDGRDEIELIVKAIDKLAGKGKPSAEKIKSLLTFKEMVSENLNAEVDKEIAEDIDDILEDMDEEIDFNHTGQRRQKRTYEEIQKVADTSRIEDDNTKNDEKKKRIGKITTWKIDDTDIPVGWYQIAGDEIKPVLIIKSSEDDKEKVKNEIVNKWMELPPEDGLIAAIYNGPDNCKIEAIDDSNRSIIYNKLKEFFPNWSIEYPKLRHPKIKLIGAEKPENISWDKWIEVATIKNKWEEAHVKVLNFQKTSANKYNVMLEIDGKTRSRIEDKRGVVAGPIGTANAHDVLAIQRCTNCLSYSHWTRECKLQEFCFRCTKNHKTFLCPRKEDTQKWWCGGCNRRGHSFLSRKCPRFLKAISVATRQVNYNYGWIMAPPPSLEERS